MRRTIWALTGALLVVAPLAVRAESRDKLVDEYKSRVGSEQNASSLVDGLRDGKTVTLKDKDGKTTTFTPPTGHMGNGNIEIALKLAYADLEKQGIKNPTNEQLKAELVKILQERADHKGWGVIAKERGFTVGDLLRNEKAEQHARNERNEHRAERPERAEKPERPERPERAEKPERPEKPERGR